MGTKRIPDKSIHVFLNMWNDGNTIKQICDITGHDPETFQRWITKSKDAISKRENQLIRIRARASSKLGLTGK